MWAYFALRSGCTIWTSHAGCSSRPSLSVSSRSPRGAGNAAWSYDSLITGRTDYTVRPYLAVSTDRAGNAGWTGWSGQASRSSRPLRSNRTGLCVRSTYYNTGCTDRTRAVRPLGYKDQFF